MDPKKVVSSKKKRESDSAIKRLTSSGGKQVYRLINNELNPDFINPSLYDIAILEHHR
jgi:hypothetical protein